jgi:hypothetical protein
MTNLLCQTLCGYQVFALSLPNGWHPKELEFRLEFLDSAKRQLVMLKKNSGLKMLLHDPT